MTATAAPIPDLAELADVSAPPESAPASAVVGWAAAHGVIAVEAMTALDNVPSHRVLERCGFERAGEIDADEGRLLRWLRRLR